MLGLMLGFGECILSHAYNFATLISLLLSRVATQVIKYNERRIIIKQVYMFICKHKQKHTSSNINAFFNRKICQIATESKKRTNHA